MPSSARSLPRCLTKRSSRFGSGGDEGRADRGAWPVVRWRRVARCLVALLWRRAVRLPCGLDADACASFSVAVTAAALPVSLDHLVGAGDQHRRHFEAERFRGLEIDAHLEFGRLVKRDISRIGTFKNPIDEIGETAIDVR